MKCRLLGIEVPTLQQVRNSARRLLAAECAAFTLNADPTTERWKPYGDWLRKLNQEHTIITFNYDRVVEKVAEGLQLRVNVVPPGDARARDRANLLKLHGSVDWLRKPVDDKSALFKVGQKPDFCVDAHDEQIAIATPGPSKSIRVGELRALWAEAEVALHGAQQVVFVGYRFPPTDADARKSILEAIHWRRTSAGARSDIRTVLGPNVHSDASARLGGLLEAVLIDSKPKQLPLYAEDFLGLAETLLSRP